MSEVKKGIYWVSWKKIMRCKKDGGLNVQSLKIKNLALLAKWHWRFISTGDALWKNVISEFYGEDVHKGLNQMGASTWNAISEVNDTIEQLGVGLKSSFFKSISNGSSSTFWDLKICAAGPKLRDIFPRLFAQEVKKDALFRERWSFNANYWNGNWAWRSDIRGRTLAELKDLEDLLHRIKFKNTGEDSWIWTSDSQGVFTVKKLSNLLQRKMATSDGCAYPTFWCSIVPIKVNIFVWRMMLNALPTNSNLQGRGISLASAICGRCGLVNEDLDHCLFSCGKLEALWRKVWAWCGMPYTRLDSIRSFKNILIARNFLGNRREITQAVLMVTVWTIWQWRNRAAHSSQEEADKIWHEDIFPMIQRLAHLWITHRKPGLKGVWHSWNSPFCR